ncbi:MAG TPA: GNAT family N-acetyltransferase [Gaiellaceae bacterium]
MPAPQIRPFEDEHLDDAARLLEERHQRHREAEPLLPENVDFRAQIAALWEKDDASGSVAVRDGRVVGYLIGAPRLGKVWGANMWIEFAGHAVREAEDVRDLYAVAATQWVEQGRPRHSALVPATDPALVHAWWRLCFGQQQALALREVPSETQVEVPGGFEIRKPDPDDLEELIEVDLALPSHQQKSPIFSGVELFSREDSREEWLKTFAGTDEEILIGYRNGKPVACWGLVAADQSGQHTGMGRPERACYLAFAATVPAARGSGIGVALTNASFAWAHEQGYESMVTDWRVTNLLASRFWPKRGFRTTFLRLYRSIP